jgi:ankyrin repeat protein
MKIAEIREVIDTLNWNRADLSGATRDELKRMDVPARLSPLIEKCEALEIPARFPRDIQNCNNAVDRGKAAILRWLLEKNAYAQDGGVQ